MLNKNSIAVLAISNTLLLGACGQGADTSSSGFGAPAAASYVQPSSPLTARLTDDAFNALDEVEQYRVANKLYSTVYKGISVPEFFNLDVGLVEPETINGGRFISSAMNRLQTDISLEQQQRLDLAILGSDEVDIESDYSIEGQYSFSRDKARELPLARIHTYPMSRQVYVQWMAWHLANSILFSPAAELDSADMTDVQNIFRRLYNSIDAGTPIRTIVEEHMRSEENWRRFRSPEDNTREMIEVFLGLEDMDADVPAASKACKDWYLTGENQGYKLSFTDFPNTEPQQVLGASIVSCDDFYKLVANHPNLLPTVAAVLVRYFYAEKDFQFQQQMVAALVADNPESFEALFSLVIFSGEYLFNNERLRSYEESFLATAERMRWNTRDDTFRSLASGSGGLYRSNMAEMGWPAMSAKLGRIGGVATDSLSFANFHKGFREELLLDKSRWSRRMGLSEQPPLDETDEQMSVAEYERRVALNRQLKILTIEELIDYLFISIATRRATEFERNELIRLYDENGYLRHEEERSYVKSGRMASLASLTFDYLSRLSEVYYFKTTIGGAQ